MMHKVKDVVSKFFHPSFLFSNNNDTDRSKRKRSLSIENNATEQQQTYANRNDRSTLIDEEDDDIQDVPSSEQHLTTDTEQEKKRRRTGNYQSLPGAYHRSDHTKLIERNYSERINQILSTPTRSFYSSSTYRESSSNYDPSKSLLFVNNNSRPTETNTKSNEFSANDLLATSLISRPQLSTTKSQQSPATLTKPIMKKNHLLSHERKASGVSYASINSYRLPYIERLRRRTLKDCIRLNQPLDNQPLFLPMIDEHKSKTTSTEPNLIKVQERECGIQCDISTDKNLNESNNKNRRTFPPADLRHEVFSVPNNNNIQSSTQESSSVQTIENLPPTIPKIEITKPKVLGDITPFEWPKFVRAQEEYAKAHPEKCSDLSSSNSVYTTVNTKTSLTSNMTGKKPLASTISVQSSWKCPSCTKDNPIQKVACSVCYGFNPNYEKMNPIASTITVEKEPITFKRLPENTNTESNSLTPITTSITTVGTTSIKVTDTSIAPAVTTTANSITIPPFGTNPLTLFAATTTKETSLPSSTTDNSTTIPPFGTAPLLLFPKATTKESSVPSSSAVTTTANNSDIPSFGTVTLPLFTPATTAAKQINWSMPSTSITATSSTTIPTLGTNSSALLFTPATTKENPVVTINSTTTILPFGTPSNTQPPTLNTASFAPFSTPVKDNPIASSMQFSFGRSASSTKSTGIDSNSPSTAIDVPMSTDVSPTLPLSGSFGTTATPPNIPLSMQTTNLSVPNSLIPTLFPPISTTLPQTTITTAPFQFGISGFRFSTGSTTDQNNSSFGISPSRLNFSGTFGTSSNSAPVFGTNSAFSNDSSSTNLLPLSSAANNGQSLFQFGVTSSVSTNPIQNSGSSSASTGGFPFPSQTTSSFGVNSMAPFPSGSSNLFNFGVPTTTPTSTSGSSSSTTNPSDDNKTTLQSEMRPMLRARRQLNNPNN